MVLLTVALDLSAVFEGRVWKRVPDIGTYKVRDELRFENCDIRYRYI